MSDDDKSEKVEIRNTVMKAKKSLPQFENISMTVKKKRPGKD
jgi:hypothetical protein